MNPFALLNIISFVILSCPLPPSDAKSGTIHQYRWESLEKSINWMGSSKHGLKGYPPASCGWLFLRKIGDKVDVSVLSTAFKI